jgi:GDP-L-fucose synthase
MKVDSKIYIAGHNGLVGSAILRSLKASGFKNILIRDHKELELTDQLATSNFFKTEKPEYVFLAAAKVGGIHANTTYPAEFFFQNVTIQTNILHQSYLNNVKRLLFLGSSCIYPKDCKQPIKEEYLLSGPLEKTNSPFAVAKISGIAMCSSYNRQYNTRYLGAMSTNLFGHGDNYDLKNGHVMAALIRKFYEAKKVNSSSVTVWGSGNPMREFLYSDDLARACIFLMCLADEKFDSLIQNDSGTKPYPVINIGTGEDISIKDLSLLIAKITGYTGEVVFDETKPDGVFRKLLDVSILKQLGWSSEISISEGIEKALQEFNTS